jgi:hypothetical protein
MDITMKNTTQQRGKKRCRDEETTNEFNSKKFKAFSKDDVKAKLLKFQNKLLSNKLSLDSLEKQNDEFHKKINTIKTNKHDNWLRLHHEYNDLLPLYVSAKRIDAQGETTLKYKELLNKVSAEKDYYNDKDNDLIKTYEDIKRTNARTINKLNKENTELIFEITTLSIDLLCI